MQLADIVIFVIVPIVIAIFSYFGLQQYRTAYRLPSGLKKKPHEFKFFIKCIASFNGLPPYVNGYIARHAGFSFAEDGVYIVFLRGFKTVVEWFILYEKIEEFKRTGKVSIGVEIQNKQEGAPPLITMLKLGLWRSDRVMEFLTEKVVRN